MAENKYKIIKTRQHPDIVEKWSIWNLIHDSYIGGEKYRKKNYLFQHPKEGTNSYEERQKRAVYLNLIQPFVDLFAGFLFNSEPTRSGVESLSELYKKNKYYDNKKNLSQFMLSLASYSLLFTVGVLVDSPNFDSEEIKTEKDRQNAGLNPYPVMYLPFQIRDFCINENSGIEWVLLDNTTYDNTDYFAKGEEKTIYRLWTKEFYQDFEIKGNIVTPQGEIPHNIGYVPFKLVNWRDYNIEGVTDSFIEDVAIISRGVYNDMSLMDEMKYSGSIRVLFFPSEDGTIPESMKVGGIGSLSCIPFRGDYSTPTFDNVNLEGVLTFIECMDFSIREIARKFGLDTDELKEYVKSGIAKKIDFKKTKSLLIAGSYAMEDTETFICRTAMRWKNGKDSDVSKIQIDYSSDFDQSDLESELNILNQLLIHPFEKLKKAVLGLIVKKSLRDEVNQKELEEILKEIKESETEQINIKDLVEEEKQSREKEGEV